MPGDGLSILRLAPTIAALLAFGCQSPESFHRILDGGLLSGGTGGDPGTGGRIVIETGGSMGTGGMGTGGAGTGGIVGTGGSSTGGSATGGSSTGGAATGGRGTGGAATGGAAGAGTAGMGGGGAGTAGGTGTAGTGAGGAGGDGGSIGTGPCAGMCISTKVISVGMNSGSLGTGETCHEVTGKAAGIVCGNFTTPRTLKVNGTTVTCVGQGVTPPAQINGGYCMHASAGLTTDAYFTTY